VWGFFVPLCVSGTKKIAGLDPFSVWLLCFRNIAPLRGVAGTAEVVLDAVAGGHPTALHIQQILIGKELIHAHQHDALLIAA